MDNKEQQTTNAFALLIAPIQRAVADQGYTSPTPIQQQAIPPLLEGRDMIGCAQTGTGKTAAFTLPILNRLASPIHKPWRCKPQSLILAPTRELAAQIGESIECYGSHLKLSHTVIFGGVGQNPQVAALKRGVHIVVATPGRLIDLLDQGHLTLDAVEVFVLDEADRMLDMGFINDIKKIMYKLPKERQTLFFSATMEPAVAELANKLVRDPVQVAIEPRKPAVERIVQQLMYVDKTEKRHLLPWLVKEHNMQRIIVFTQMKHQANRVCQFLEEAGISAAAIHGNKSQSARTRALADFKAGKVVALVATDIAARGIDVDNISHVINYDLPKEPETYVHRIGRTARAGTEGDAISFCSSDEVGLLRTIQKLIGYAIPVEVNQPYHSASAITAAPAAPREQGKGTPGQRGDQPNRKNKSRTWRTGNKHRAEAGATR
jgi:ATP-dependent RNA helicase RhlE